MRFSLMEQAKVVEAIAPQANGSALAGDHVSLAKAGRLFVVAHINQADATPVAVTLKQAQDASGTGAKVVTNTMPIWADEDLETSDEMVRQTDAVSFTTSATLKHKMVVFQVDPAEILDVDGGFSYLQVNVGASNAANIVSVLYVATNLRYGAAESLVA